MAVLLINVLALWFSLFVGGILIGAIFSKPVRQALKKVFARIRRDIWLAKVSQNPVIRPGGHPWEAEAVLNPAALLLGGRTHLIYRAIGSDGISRLGYASSGNGIVFDDRLPYPAYVSQNPGGTMPSYTRRYSPVMYPSGGSWGGCEDPRMVTIEGQVYVTFNMFENWILRVAYISITEEDFLAKRFYKWDGPYVLSHGSRDKNWVLFPEKIGGKFAVLHSIIGEDADHVRVEYVEDLWKLRFRAFESPDPQQTPDELIAWHTHVRSAGPPPLRTDAGWLLFYHAHDTHEPSKYKLGAMLLDLNDPTKVIQRSHFPVLSPDERYENEGKPGIIYACGAAVRDDMLYIYYGGADKVVCVAYAHLPTFLAALSRGMEPELEKTPTQTA